MGKHHAGRTFIVLLLLIEIVDLGFSTSLYDVEVNGFLQNTSYTYKYKFDERLFFFECLRIVRDYRLIVVFCSFSYYFGNCIESIVFMYAMVTFHLLFVPFKNGESNFIENM